MQRLVGLIAAFAACGTLALAEKASQAREAATGQAGPWGLHQTEHGCYIARTIASGGRKMDVFINSYGSSTPYHVTVRGTGLPLMPSRAVVASVGFGGDQPPAKTFVIVGKSSDVPMATFVAYPPRPTPAPTRMMGNIYLYTRSDAQLGAMLDPAGEVLSLDMTGMAPLSLPLGSMQGEYERLDACAQALEDKWSAEASGGVEPAKAPELRHAGEVSWHMKYPENLLLGRVSGLVELRMTIDTKGRVRDCIVQLSTWTSRFGDMACRHLETVARFDPARDAQGNAINSLFRTSAVFLIYNW